MKKSDKPHNYFIGAILRGYDKEREKSKEVTCSGIWDHIVMECFRKNNGFTDMFSWDTSKAKDINRIGTIIECIERGYVPTLSLTNNEKGDKIVACSDERYL